MIECLKILLVLFLDMGDGEEVDGYSCVAYRSGSTDTRTGNVVGVGSQSFLSTSYNTNIFSDFQRTVSAFISQSPDAGQVERLPAFSFLHICHASS